MPFLSPYCASKFALEGFGICLNQEMKILNKLSDTNIKVSLIEPGAYATGFNKENNEKSMLGCILIPSFLVILILLKNMKLKYGIFWSKNLLILL